MAPRDPKQRPTAREALKHPWLHGGTTADRGEGAPLDKTVVQRLQVPLRVLDLNLVLSHSLFEAHAPAKPLHVRP